MLDRRSVIAGVAGWMIVPAAAVRAQAWPSQPVKLVVPYGPGGASDALGRVVAEKMTALLGQQVIVENKAGGNTIIGMDAVAKAKPDGHTLLLGSTTMATNVALGFKQPFDPLKDFQTISTIADIHDLLAVNKDLPVKDYASFAAWVNAQPNPVRFACSGIGNQPHLWGELFRTRNKLRMEVVGYKGSADALRDVTAGHVPVFVDVVMPTGSHVNQGRLTGICIASPERSPICPMVPTVVELGMPDLVGAAFYGLVAPAGVPGPIAERLNAVCLDIVKDEAVKKKLAELGLVTTGSTAAAFLERVKAETDRWSRVVKENDIKVEG
ncbi:Bug family tripartite tricarboxylate transporter substrate binding protein [Reyranella sp.]|uniref:Bug family tripartite tricarboxylate transporter substrate binding protein n=1 Tax=Reyranella sp. TaxID=1929291 RepID=UPI003D0B87FE